MHTSIYIYKILFQLSLSISVFVLCLSHYSLSVNNSTTQILLSAMNTYIHIYYIYYYNICVYDIYILSNIFCLFSHKNINQTHRNNCLQYTFARYFYNASELYIVISNLCFFPAYKQILNTYQNTRNTRYTKYTAYHQQKNNNKQNRINANENEIRIPAHLYALSHMSYTQYSLTNQHEHETTTNETLQSNGRTAREGVPTYTQTYTHTTLHLRIHTHTYSDPAAWLSLFLKVTHISCCNQPVPTLSLSRSCSLALSLSVSHKQALSAPLLNF